jgi:hypothetical protein
MRINVSRALVSGAGRPGRLAVRTGDARWLMVNRAERRHATSDEVARTIEDADTLTDLGAVVPREVLEAARDELENPADESDEG